MEDSGTIKKDIYQLILHKFSKYPELEGVISLEDSAKYKDILNLLYIALSTVVEDEKNVSWGIAVPVTPVIFYGSNQLYDLMSLANSPEINLNFEVELESFEKQKCEMLYSFLLGEFYNFHSTKKQEMIRSVLNKETGLVKYYRVNVDTRFVKVTASQPLPDINLESLQANFHEKEGLELLMGLLPLNMFHFTGFSLITITEATDQYALEKIKDILVNGHGKTDENSYQSAVQSLKAMGGSNELEFGLLPLFKVNNKIVEDIDAYCHSIIFSMGKQHGITKSFFIPMIEKFVANPHLIFFRDLDVLAPAQQQVGNILKLAGIKSYALMPVYFNNKLVGSFEIYARQKNLLDERIFAKIEPAMTLIAQLMRNSIDEFDTRISDTIRDKFTSLQPSVQWKFNEAAWDHLYRTKMDGKPAEVQKIEFKQVYPIYSAVDMRNSTIERNKAVLNDLKYQFDHLQRVLDALKQKSSFALTDEFIFKCSKWQNIFEGIFTTNDEIKLNQFLNEEVHPFLRHFKDANPELTPVIAEYFETIRQGEGKAWENRHQLEESMQLINNSINNYLDLMNEELQRAYPCYFEKFRTDGVEYDIYIGQSIAPEKPFDLVYLKNLRLWQLTSMAAIARLSHGLLPKMRVPLKTTQLIFIYSNTIDISFRNDERRFDVEGGYNIRYQIIKKRIDKVTIKNSRERLTQPGKIALIYFSQKDADEYISYIHHLQDKKILYDDLEYLELEELQGVSGLKALRVGVNTGEESQLQTSPLSQPTAIKQL
jgi:DNA-directed RNA polymerase delta subunit